MQREMMQRMGIEDQDKAPPLSNFTEAADKRVRLGLLLRHLIADQALKVETADIRAHVQQMCSSYENSEDMVKAYMGSEQIVKQVEPMVLEQKAIDWLTQNGKNKAKKITFTEYMNS